MFSMEFQDYCQTPKAFLCSMDNNSNSWKIAIQGYGSFGISYLKEVTFNQGGGQFCKDGQEIQVTSNYKQSSRKLATCDGSADHFPLQVTSSGMIIHDLEMNAVNFAICGEGPPSTFMTGSTSTTNAFHTIFDHDGAHLYTRITTEGTISKCADIALHPSDPDLYSALQIGTPSYGIIQKHVNENLIWTTKMPSDTNTFIPGMLQFADASTLVFFYSKASEINLCVVNTGTGDMDYCKQSLYADQDFHNYLALGQYSYIMSCCSSDDMKVVRIDHSVSTSTATYSRLWRKRSNAGYVYSIQIEPTSFGEISVLFVEDKSMNDYQTYLSFDDFSQTPTVAIALTDTTSSGWHRQVDYFKGDHFVSDIGQSTWFCSRIQASPHILCAMFSGFDRYKMRWTHYSNHLFMTDRAGSIYEVFFVDLSYPTASEIDYAISPSFPSGAGCTTITFAVPQATLTLSTLNLSSVFGEQIVTTNDTVLPSEPFASFSYGIIQLQGVLNPYIQQVCSTAYPYDIPVTQYTIPKAVETQVTYFEWNVSDVAAHCLNRPVNIIMPASYPWIGYDYSKNSIRIKPPIDTIEQFQFIIKAGQLGAEVDIDFTITQTPTPEPLAGYCDPTRKQFPTHSAVPDHEIVDFQSHINVNTGDIVFALFAMVPEEFPHYFYLQKNDQNNVPQKGVKISTEYPNVGGQIHKVEWDTESDDNVYLLGHFFQNYQKHFLIKYENSWQWYTKFQFGEPYDGSKAQNFGQLPGIILVMGVTAKAELIGTDQDIIITKISKDDGSYVEVLVMQQTGVQYVNQIYTNSQFIFISGGVPDTEDIYFIRFDTDLNPSGSVLFNGFNYSETKHFIVEEEPRYFFIYECLDVTDPEDIFFKVIIASINQSNMGNSYNWKTNYSTSYYVRGADSANESVFVMLIDGSTSYPHIITFSTFDNTIVSKKRLNNYLGDLGAIQYFNYGLRISLLDNVLIQIVDFLFHEDLTVQDIQCLNSVSSTSLSLASMGTVSGSYDFTLVSKTEDDLGTPNLEINVNSLTYSQMYRKTGVYEDASCVYELSGDYIFGASMLQVLLLEEYDIAGPDDIQWSNSCTGIPQPYEFSFGLDSGKTATYIYGDNLDKIKITDADDEGYEVIYIIYQGRTVEFREINVRLCPDGQWLNRLTYICEDCYYECAKCYGPSKTECTQCMEGILKILVNNECVKPKCLERYLWDWDTYECLPCHNTCQTCSAYEETDCIKCVWPLRYVQNKCLGCEKLPGLRTNDEQLCEEICGDGVLYHETNGHNCDDGNNIDGDGCDAECMLEIGWSCTNTTCIDVYAPKYQLDQMTETNVAVITFDESVILKPGALDKENVLVEIKGPVPPYGAEWEFTRDFTQDETLDQIIIKLFNFTKTINAIGEQMHFSFVNHQLIADSYNNPLVENVVVGNLSEVVVVSEMANASVQESGNSAKFTTILMLILNVALKIILKKSMSFMWDLVHVLQVFRYEMLLNIDFPWNVLMLGQLMKFSNGSIEEIDKIIPNIVAEFFDMEQLDKKTKEVPSNYENAGIDSPYLIENYSLFITKGGFIAFIVIPLLVILALKFRKKPIVIAAFSFLFFNGTLRILIEIYIDIIVECFVNFDFLFFSNTEQLIASIFAFLCTAASFTFPFVAMYQLSKQYRQLENGMIKSRYFPLIEGIKLSKIMSMTYYYYGIFMIQRLFLAAVIVFLIDFPISQLSSILLSNILFISYMYKVRPMLRKSQNISIIVDEIFLLICNVGFFFIHLAGMTAEEKVFLGWFICLLMAISVTKNLIIAGYNGWLSFQAYRAEKRERKAIQAEKLNQKQTQNEEQKLNDTTKPLAMEQNFLVNPVQNEIYDSPDHPNDFTSRYPAFEKNRVNPINKYFNQVMSQRLKHSRTVAAAAAQK